MQQEKPPLLTDGLGTMTETGSTASTNEHTKNNPKTVDTHNGTQGPILTYISRTHKLIPTFHSTTQTMQPPIRLRPTLNTPHGPATDKTPKTAANPEDDQQKGQQTRPPYQEHGQEANELQRANKDLLTLNR